METPDCPVQNGCNPVRYTTERICSQRFEGWTGLEGYRETNCDFILLGIGGEGMENRVHPPRISDFRHDADSESIDQLHARTRDYTEGTRMRRCSGCVGTTTEHAAGVRKIGRSTDGFYFSPRTTALEEPMSAGVMPAVGVVSDHPGDVDELGPGIFVEDCAGGDLGYNPAYYLWRGGRHSGGHLVSDLSQEP
jgi:hypothetical protein